MTIQFPPSRRTTTREEAERLAKLTGVPSQPLITTLRDDLNFRVANHPVRLDYVNFGGDTVTLAHVCLLTNDDGDQQFWLGLNVGHPFVQFILNDTSGAQRSGIEVMLLTIFGCGADLDDPETDAFYVREMVELGKRLGPATEILESLFWPHGRPEEEAF